MAALEIPAAPIPTTPAESMAGARYGAENRYGADDRRSERERVEMIAHFRRNLANNAVMLKDLTCFGAKIEGIGHMEPDEAVSLTLPGCRPMLAFVAWADDHSAGLEFADPLQNAVLADLVARFGMGRAA